MTSQMETTTEYNIDKLKVMPCGGLYKIELWITEKNADDAVQIPTFFYNHDPAKVLNLLNAANEKKELTVRVERGEPVKNWIYADGERVGDYIEGPFRSPLDGKAY